MKKIIELLLVILLFTGCASNVKTLAVIETKNQKGDAVYYKLLENGKISKTDKKLDDYNKNINIYNLNSCFESYIKDNEVLNKLVVGCDETFNTYPDVLLFNNSEISNKESLLEEIANLKHDLSVVNVFEINKRTFINVELNVNVTSPSDIYEYKNNKLIKLSSLKDGEQIEKIYTNE